MKESCLSYRRLASVLIPTFLGIIYILLCTFNLQQSVWFDESYGAYLTRFSFADIWNLTALDVHPPLYYFLLKIWSNIFGYTDFAMRFMSVFFGAIAIVFAWAWLKRKFGLKLATIASIFIVTSPMLIRYGQEMRMYTLAAAIVFAATFTLQLAIDTNKRRFWVIYGGLLSLGMWTHYFTALIWIAQLAYLVYRYRKKIFQKNIMLSYGLAVVLFLPWIPFFLSQTSTVQRGFWVSTPNANTITSFFSDSLFYAESDLVSGWLLMLAIAYLTLLYYFFRNSKLRLGLLLSMTFLPPVLLLILSLPPLTPVFVDRYLINSSVCLSILSGLLFGNSMLLSKTQAVPIKSVKAKANFHSFLNRHITALRVFSLVIIVSASVWGIYNVYSLGNYNKSTDSKSDVKSLFQAVASASTVGEPIISSTEWLYYDLAFYGNDEHPVYFIDETTQYQYGSHEPLRQQDYGKILDLDAFLEEYDCIWYLGDLPSEGDLNFPRSDLVKHTAMTLSVNINQSDYQAIEFCKE